MSHEGEEEPQPAVVESDHSNEPTAEALTEVSSTDHDTIAASGNVVEIVFEGVETAKGDHKEKEEVVLVAATVEMAVDDTVGTAESIVEGTETKVDNEWVEEKVEEREHKTVDGSVEEQPVRESEAVSVRESDVMASPGPLAYRHEPIFSNPPPTVNGKLKEQNESVDVDLLANPAAAGADAADTNKLLNEQFRVTYVDIYSWKIKKDERGNVYVVYLVHVSLQNGLKWIVERRYQQFLSLRSELKKRHADHARLSFPTKKWFFNLSEKTIRSRLRKLQDYMNSVLALLPYPEEVSKFLEVEAHVQSTSESSARMSERFRTSSMQSLTAAASIHNFTLVKVLGKGSFGKVFLVKPAGGANGLRGGIDIVFAMKVLKKVEIVKKHQVEHTKTERYILEKIDNNFILKLRYSFQTKQKLYMVTDYCSGGELFFHLKKMKKFTEKMATFYVAQIALGLRHLHEHNIIYRDLKPENILLDRYGNCKITDFGLSKIITPETDVRRLTFCGTPEYLAPEVIMMRRLGHGSYGVEVDWWALGIISFELLTGWPPFNDRDFSKLCQKILTQLVKFPPKLRISIETQQFVGLLLVRDPKARLACGNPYVYPERSFESFMANPFFGNMDWDALRNCKVTPPFVPNQGIDLEDTRNFDKEFTRMTLKDSPVDASVISDEIFEGFSFSEPEMAGMMKSGSDSNFRTSNISRLSMPIERDPRPYMSTNADSILRLSECILDPSSSPVVDRRQIGHASTVA